MLETNQKFRTIIVERRTKAGKWVFHSKVIQENPFTEKDIKHLASSYKNQFRHSNFKFVTLKGAQIINFDRHSCGFLYYCERANLISIEDKSSGEITMFSPNNYKFLDMNHLYGLIKTNGYIKSFTKFDEEEEDGYIICGKVVFNNGLTVTAAFYR
jgi:hypothetical protein